MPLCLEKKLTLSGTVQVFECELLHLNNGFGMLKYIIDREYHIGEIKLRPGDITHALYWTDRPYTLYIWRLDENQPIYYFNIADRIALSPDEFVWRDLVIDIVIDANRKARVLDENELPGDLPPELLRYIHSARDHVLGHYGDIIDEADRAVTSCMS